MNHQKGENEHTNEFMVNLHESFVVAEQACELATFGYVVRRATDCHHENMQI